MVDALTVEALRLLPGVRHAFCGRGGGVSRAPFDTLNCGADLGDAQDAVRQNLARVAASLGVRADQLLIPRQRHGAVAAIVDTVTATNVGPVADALVTACPDLAVGVLTADCGSVLCIDPAAGIVAAAHAGWRGALAGILENTVATMEQLGAARARIIAAIGPCIGARSYAVGPEFPAPFLAWCAADARFFQVGPDSGLRFDLGGYLVARLHNAGVGVVDVIGIDTLSAPERFFSHRRQRGDPCGRQLSAIARLNHSV